MIEHTYKKTNADRILEEMEASLADKSILLSLDPWAPTENVGKKYSQDTRFMLLGSVDIHNINLSEIESTIKSYVDNYHIVGLKFHPNLQNFKPEPYKNGDEIAKKLRKIYETAAKYKLYVLFHGGISNYTLKINRKYGYIERSRTNGLLENFCDKDGASELLSAYDIKVIIAHIGHYGMVNIDYRLIKKLSDKYSNLFFDTSGVSTSVISRTLNIIPSSKLIFGSDALYNRIAYNIGCVYLAAKKCNNGETSGDIMGNILGRNFVNKFISV
jgi:predicted TIM-barrel fold metal-dependent hydrolase